MSKFRPVRFIALFLAFCLLTDPLTESAFSSGLVPGLGAQAVGPMDQVAFRRSAFTAPWFPMVQENSMSIPFSLLTIPWQRLWLEAIEPYQPPKFTWPDQASIRQHLQALQSASWPTTLLVTQAITRPSNIPPTHRRLYLNGWVADFNRRLAASALKKYLRHLKELSIFGVGADRDGSLLSEDDFIHSALVAMKPLKRRPRVLLTVANNRRRHLQDRWLLHQWLDGPEKRERHIADLLAVAKPVDGLDIDYENLRPGDGPAYTEFIEDLGLALHARGKYLSVTVEPQMMYFGDLDWKIVSAQVDRVRVMAYQFHYGKTRPGAVAPPEIVRRLAQRALTEVPVQKLEIALPLYGFDWDTTRTDGARGQGDVVATLQQFQQLSRRFPAWMFRDPETRSARIDYLVLNGNRLARHEVWYEDSASLAYKVRQLQRLGIVHIGIWQLGVGEISDLFATFTGTTKRRSLSALTPLKFIEALMAPVAFGYDFQLPTLFFSHQTASALIALLLKQ